MSTQVERPITRGMHTVSPAALACGVRQQTVAGRTPGPGETLRKGYARRRPVVQRIWAKVIQDGSGCWTFTGSLNNGYGSTSVLDEQGVQWTVSAHRVMYEAVKGSIPFGLQIDHLCRNRACCNPWHLEAVTCSVNIRRAKPYATYAAPRDRCVRGHRRARTAGRLVCVRCGREPQPRARLWITGVSRAAT